MKKKSLFDALDPTLSLIFSSSLPEVCFRYLVSQGPPLITCSPASPPASPPPVHAPSLDWLHKNYMESLLQIDLLRFQPSGSDPVGQMGPGRPYVFFCFQVIFMCSQVWELFLDFCYTEIKIYFSCSPVVPGLSLP